MKKLNIYKAAPIGTDEGFCIEDVVIQISGNIETVIEKADLKVAEAIYDKEAESIASALQNSLPQGIFYRLTAKMIERTAGAYAGRVLL